jgi:hypothetical protein
MGNQEVLGERLRVMGWACRGSHPLESLKMRHQALVHYCSMTPVQEPLVWGYPLDGKGGVGETVFLPFGEGAPLGWFKRKLLKFLVQRFRWAFMIFQPFVESYCVIDTYPEYSDGTLPRGKITIILATCIKPPDSVSFEVNRLFGPVFKSGKFEL